MTEYFHVILRNVATKNLAINKLKEQGSGNFLTQENREGKPNHIWQLPGWQCEEERQTGEYSMLTLAYIGDAVYELLVRQHISSADIAKVKQMHRKTIGLVCAETQAALALAIEPMLTETEKDVLRRGRNAKGGHLPKNTTAPTYRLATGLEALVGYLYLEQNLAKLTEIFTLLWQWEAGGEIPAPSQEKDKPTPETKETEEV